MGYTINYGDNNGWNTELYLDGEANKDKWSWLYRLRIIDRNGRIWRTLYEEQ